MTDKNSSESRRKLLKSIAAGSGAIVAGKSLPESWSRPVVDSVMLPVHAQTSQNLGLSFVSCSSFTPPFGTISGSFPVTITPATEFIPIDLVIQSNLGVIVNTDPSGVYQTDAGGEATVTPFSFTGDPGDQIVLRFTFANSTDGTGFCDSVFDFV